MFVSLSDFVSELTSYFLGAGTTPVLAWFRACMAGAMAASDLA
jgi:hypothetical protein